MEGSEDEQEGSVEGSVEDDRAKSNDGGAK